MDGHRSPFHAAVSLGNEGDLFRETLPLAVLELAETDTSDDEEEDEDEDDEEEEDEEEDEEEGDRRNKVA